jgi:hypothetical protein
VHTKDGVRVYVAEYINVVSGDVIQLFGEDPVGLQVHLKGGENVVSGVVVPTDLIPLVVEEGAVNL